MNALLAEAGKVDDGLATHYYLNQAASTARRLHLADLETEATSRLQTAAPIEWRTVSTETHLPAAVVNEYMRPFRKAPTWQEAVAAWCNTPVPSGRASANTTTAKHILNRSVFRSLVSTVIVGASDLPQRVTTGEDAAFEQQLALVERLNFGANSFLLAGALDLIRFRFGIPPRADLESLIAASGTHPTHTRLFAAALYLYWVDEFDACVHLAVPRVEAAARALLLELNEPVYRASSVGTKIGQFPGLGELLPHLLDGGLDPDWERFLRTFLLSDGANLRNLVAHGFATNTDRMIAALALRACAILILITAADTAQRDADAVKAAIARPIRPPIRRRWWQRLASATRAAYLELR
ncbi:hypothetical protein [Fodinicola feengrottensis]|uniref:hypothetical protein n=1 Tax=Fodinicola feengrottensis TaxID=435914 RepID=UPI00244359CC|nr:hypothetical protein [Fodinicola feengrottensis]